MATPQLAPLPPLRPIARSLARSPSLAAWMDEETGEGGGGSECKTEAIRKLPRFTEGKSSPGALRTGRLKSFQFPSTVDKWTGAIYST